MVKIERKNGRNITEIQENDLFGTQEIAVLNTRNWCLEYKELVFRTQEASIARGRALISFFRRRKQHEKQ